MTVYRQNPVDLDSGTTHQRPEAQVAYQSLPAGGEWTGAAIVRADRASPTASEWTTFLRRVTEEPGALPKFIVLKHSPATRVLRCQMDSGAGQLDVVCKQYVVGGLARRALGLIRRSRGRLNFDRALALQKCGISTATPLAWIQRRSSRRESWLITRFVPDLVDLDRIALTVLPKLDGVKGRRLISTVIDSTANLFARLERNNLHHRDLKASNILFALTSADTVAGDAWITDLDGLRECRRLRTRDRRQPLVRLAASLIGYTSITRTDYARFLRAYARRIDASTSIKSLYRSIATGAVDYRRKAQRRKRNKLDGYADD